MKTMWLFTSVAKLGDKQRMIAPNMKTMALIIIVTLLPIVVYNETWNTKYFI